MKFAIKNSFSEDLIHQIAKDTGFVKRVRKLPASRFLNTLMFSIYNQAKTSLLDIAADLNQQFSIDISKEALHKRFTPQSVKFLEALIKKQLSQQLVLSKNDTLTSSFRCIKIKDSTKFSLPYIYHGDYPGFGNFSKKNGLMNLQYEYDLVSGNWSYIKLTNCRRNDQQDSKKTIGLITKGDLYIRDLGYITPTYLKSVIKKEAFFINRMRSGANIYTLNKERLDWSDINAKLNKMGTNAMEMNVLIYKKDMVQCRLVIERVSNDEYVKRLKHAKNRAKSHGVGLSDKHKSSCRYNTFITNVDSKILPLKNIRKVYYQRWQIELVFKTWKSFFEINKVKKVKKERMECQILAKLLWILLNWQLFKTCNRYVQRETPEKGVSVLKFFKRCLSFSQTLREVVLKKQPLEKWLNNVFLPLIDNTACEAPWGKTTHYQVKNAFLDALS